MASGEKREDCRGEGREREVVYVQPAYMGEPDDEIDLLDLWCIIWRGKWFIIGFVALATIAAAFVSFYVLPVTYKSEVVLQTRGDAGVMVNYLNNRVLSDLKNVPQNVKSYSKQEVSTQKGLLTISWVDHDPARTKEILDKIVKAARNYIKNEYESSAEQELEFIRKQLQESRQDFVYWQNKQPDSDLTLSQIQGERRAAEETYIELRKQLELAKIEAHKSRPDFAVLKPAYVPDSRYKPNRKLICTLTLVTSLFVSVFLVFFWNFVRNARGRLKEKRG